MVENISNDNQSVHARSRGTGPDPHGQAAMLLVESLIHALVENKVISLELAIEVVDLATEVKEAIADNLGDSPEALAKSLGLLNGLSRSLQIDREDG